MQNGHFSLSLLDSSQGVDTYYLEFSFRKFTMRLF